MSNHSEQNKRAHQTKIKQMEQMIDNTLANAKETEESMQHAESIAQREKLKSLNENRLESVENFRREIDEERSLL
ncbi:hypothetical protein QYG89_13960 [Bacillus sp. B190/17]|uniref:Small, acid-soluble spore protein Tlp n=1 Tax=Bacillus lumedeiriae TaxID=3058829 RepID=A0ABW8IB75_9BACI